LGHVRLKFDEYLKLFDNDNEKHVKGYKKGADTVNAML